MITNQVNNQELKTSNVKQVWGGGGNPSAPADAKPSESVTSHYN